VVCDYFHDVDLNHSNAWEFERLLSDATASPSGTARKMGGTPFSGARQMNLKISRLKLHPGSNKLGPSRSACLSNVEQGRLEHKAPLLARMRLCKSN